MSETRTSVRAPSAVTLVSLIFLPPAWGAHVPPQVFAPDVISASGHDAAPAFTSDGKTVYFQRSSAAASTILVSHLVGGRWSTPEIASFSGRWDDLEPAMAPDGSYLIFVSSRPISDSGKALDGFYSGTAHPGHGGNLWRVDRAGSGWSEPVRLPETVNRGATIFAPSVVADGSIYFMEPYGEKGRFRLLRSQYRDGSYEAAQPVPFSDGTFTDVDPAVAPDESFMVFGSGRPPAKSMDLFIVFREGELWGTPLHLGDDVNQAGSDAEPRLSPDRRTLYFSSERVLPVTLPRDRRAARRDLARLSWDNGQYNIWHVPLAPWLAPDLRR